MISLARTLFVRGVFEVSGELSGKLPKVCPGNRLALIVTLFIGGMKFPTVAVTSTGVAPSAAVLSPASMAAVVARLILPLLRY